MSDNQSRGSDKNEYKRSGQSGNPNSPRNVPGGGGGRGGGSSSSTTTTPPSGTNFPGRGVNHGVLRTPRGQPPGQYIGGILYEQMQTPSQLGVPMQHNNLDSDRWQPATNFHKGLIPSPQTPGIHKAERMYEIGKIIDEEQAKQRKLKGILKKMNPQNFEKLFDQVKQVNIDNADTLSGVIGQIFEKALMKPTFVEMYANFCSRLSVDLPDFSENDEKITFKRLLINKCQEEFERGEREEEEANRTEEEGGEVKQTEEEREEARRRKLGNIRLIGELYKKRMLTERIMHECIKKLLGINQTPDPDEENIEALCKLMSTIGEMIDHPKAKEHMDVYFDMMFKLSNNMDFSSRVRLMLKDAIELRKNKWQHRRKYGVGKITDEEQTKERQLKGILYKLTPQNFENLLDQVKQVNIDNADTLCVFVEQIFEKALMEPTFVEMYANFCSRLSVELPDFSENNEKITFKKLLMNKCQEEFERGEREEEEANRIEEGGEVKQTEEEREETRAKARRRKLGNIRLIGELYKKRMLTERNMHGCIKKLLGINQTADPNEENIEALCKLMSTIGEMIDHPKGKEEMDVYFDMMFKLSNNMDFSSRVRFMLKDAIDLRKNKWQQRAKVESPKKINKVHKEAAQQRQAQANRLASGPSSNPTTRRAQMDFGPKGSNVLPSTPQMGGYRGLPQQIRACGNTDPRLDTFENRPLSVPLSAMGDDTITLGSQGDLARGMSVRGQTSMRGMSLHDMDSRRGVAGPSGYGSISERAGYGQEDLAGRGFGQVLPSSPPELPRVTIPLQSGPLDKVMSEERLHDKSIEMIKEFYSARDEKEVALCIKDLNAPSFYPSMISIWVIDSFERKDVDRESLTKLLINLAKSRDGILSQDSLVRGFKSVLSTLEDAVNDAPKAAEFLGRIFAKVLLENVIPYTEVWRLIYEGGEEQGRLVEIGLAAEVLGVILEIIKSDKGDSFLHNMRMGSDLRLENFRPPTIKKTSRRGVAGPSGYGSISKRAGYGQEDLAGRGFGQVLPSSPPELPRVTTPLQSGPLDKVMSEERLHDKSIMMIKEFYSARDEKEVALCIKDLNAPSFYPSMISIWVIDSFERKDVDRESLTKLLINLAKSRDGILSQDSLVRGFKSVLSTLEDAVLDAPKAAEFLGRIFAKVLLENVIPYTEVWRLIYEGGEEQGRLVEIGLAAEVLGVILEIIKSEKGDSFLHNMRMGSDLRLENFRPPTIKKTSRLDKFI